MGPPMDVILGGCRFRNCPTIIQFGSRPVLRSRRDGFVDLDVVDGSDGGDRVVLSLRGSEIETADEVIGRQLAFRKHDDECRLFFQDLLIVSVSRLSETATNLHLELRPLGLLVWSDVNGLHVGQTKEFLNLAFENESPAIHVVG